MNMTILKLDKSVRGKKVNNTIDDQLNWMNESLMYI